MSLFRDNNSFLLDGMRPAKRKLTKVTQSLIDVFAVAAGKASLTFICLLFLSKRNGFLIHHGRSFVHQNEVTVPLRSILLDRMTPVNWENWAANAGVR
ncbi:hypothetical protein IRJ41_011153 [Triplophysa rosa]|uniref:Uncharacterized protein n=1 Tax=Triplophysa rosa TaxID=992332 RepID=A0A9W7WUJ2_TRIRA|nr:hypothetical protein IRJ41_011153 [Triplophysa rosa]